MILIKLVWTSVRKEIAPWMSLIVLSTAVAIVLTLDMGLVLAGVNSSGEAGQAFVAMGGVALGFSVLTGIISLVLVTGICIRLKQRTVALWQIVGVQPSAAFMVVLGEVLCVTALSSLAGCGLANVCWSPFTHFIHESGLPDSVTLHGGLPKAASAAGIGTTAIIGGIASSSSALRIVRCNILASLRMEPGKRQRAGVVRNVFRFLLAVSSAIGLLFLYLAISKAPTRRTAQETGDFLTVYPGMGILLCLVIAMSAGFIMKLLLIPGKWVPPESLGWFLAFREVTARPGLTRAMVVPISVAGGAVGVMVSWVSKLRTILSGGGVGDEVSAPPGQMALLFSGPVIVACVGAASVVFATASDRVKDVVLLLAGGATHAEIVRKSVSEVAIYFGLASVLTYVIVITNELAMTWSLRRGPVAETDYSPPAWEPLVVVVFGVALIAVMLAPISAVSQRVSIVETIGKD